MDKIIIDGIRFDEIKDRWVSSLDKWIADSLSNANEYDLTLDSIKESLVSRDMQLWLIYKWRKLVACCITQINVTNDKTLVAVIVAGNEMEKWVSPLDDLLVRYAKFHECKYVKAYGRRGWSKQLKSLGWSEPSVTYCKEV